ncbi:hypothetical protein PMG71_02030 [Roseofilum sp. BLCC_M154]|uniref:Glycosyltransferase RgtA/B/C/D-like domain-containing protein n=1 Tax=Roseofilum acuticapitatum BLCC-M154 TaxID=3022444 RepID=A0ABT7AMS7_9CYAN|nr:hypothetical protein [Roseofilum acuticapitatum]MDJ1168204.1 hypothetical protein [Roseofilum acuticapitatum BLCC-M154]
MARFLPTRWPLVVLFLVAIATRLPFQSQILYEHDSVNFAWAMEEFDLERHQPHAPGTFIVLILSARLLNLWFKDANQSLVMVNIIAMAIATCAIYVLGNLWFNRTVGWIAALLMLSSPLIWFYSEVGLSYTLELAWVTLIAIACHHTRNGNHRALLLSALLLGLSGGIRPNTPIFLFPLWSVATGLAWREKRYGATEIILALGMGAIGVLLWGIPLLILSGGLDAYAIAIQTWLDRHLEDSDSIQEIISNLRLWLYTLVMTLGFVTIPLLGWVTARRFRLPPLPIRDWRTQAILLWCFPSVFYLTFVHFQRQGHSYTVMPVVILLAALVLNGYVEQNRWRSPQTLKLWVVSFILCNSLLFIWGPTQWRTWTSLQDYDRFVQQRLEVIEQTFPPSSTTVLSSGQYARLVSYYFRDYFSADLSMILTEDLAFLDPRVNTLVLFDSKILANSPANLQIQEIPLPGGDRLRYIQWQLPQNVQVSKNNLLLQSN